MLRKTFPRRKKKKKNLKKKLRRLLKHLFRKYYLRKKIWILKNIKSTLKKIYHAPIYFFNVIRNKNVIFIKHTKIILFILRYFKVFKKIYSKKRIFLLNILIYSLIYLLKVTHTTSKKNLLLNNFRHINNILSKRIFLVIYITHLNLLSHNYLQLQYNKQIFQKNIYIFHLYSKILLFTLRKAIFIPNNRYLNVRFYIMNNLNITANFLVNYMIIKLGQYFQLNDIISPIIRYLKRLNDLEGFRFVFSGRLTRKERAAYIVRSHKSMPLSTYSTTIDYASDFKIMKFGVVASKFIYFILATFHTLFL